MTVIELRDKLQFLVESGKGDLLVAVYDSDADPADLETIEVVSAGPVASMFLHIPKGAPYLILSDW